MYRVRLNLNWKIGDGYFMQARLGHNGLAGYGVFGKGLSLMVLEPTEKIILNLEEEQV